MTPTQIVLIVVGIIVLLVLMVLVWFISVRNGFLRMQQDIESSESRIDVYLTKRFDLLTKMVQTTKNYVKHEKETLEKIVSMRNPGANASIEEKAQFEKEMTAATKALNVVVENYPDLKANTVVIGLQNAITEVEENLQASRSTYNSNVSIYNKSIIVFPNSIVAGSRFTKRNYFEAEATKRADVNIEF